MLINDIIVEERSADPKIVAKFADVDPKHRSYYITKWAEDNGIDSDKAMELAGYVKDGYIGAGAYNWKYVGEQLDENPLKDIGSAIGHGLKKAAAGVGREFGSQVSIGKLQRYAQIDNEFKALKKYAGRVTDSGKLTAADLLPALIRLGYTKEAVEAQIDAVVTAIANANQKKAKPAQKEPEPKKGATPGTDGLPPMPPEFINWLNKNHPKVQKNNVQRILQLKKQWDNLQKTQPGAPAQGDLLGEAEQGELFNKDNDSNQIIIPWANIRTILNNLAKTKERKSTSTPDDKNLTPREIQAFTALEPREMKQYIDALKTLAAAAGVKFGKE